VAVNSYTPATDYARQRRLETKRRSKLRSLGLVPQLPQCELCGQKLLVQRALPRCFDCSKRKPNLLRDTAEQLIRELQAS